MCIVKVPAGYISKVQSLDVHSNKPLKYIIRKCWKDHIITVVKDAGDEANNNPSF